MTHDDLRQHVRALLDVNRYLTLGTVDADGNPWTSPVFFAAAGEREYYWLSALDAQHSRNIAVHAQVSLVVFDSTVPPYHGRAIYAVGAARELAGGDIERALEIYPGPESRGAGRFVPEDVIAPAPYRLYQVSASDLWVLCPRESRQPCELHGRATDHRVRVE
jgi:Pyridoxamine 5'-phosphate oxidase